MSQSDAVAVGGHTRWGRALLAMLPALMIILVLAALLFTHLAATFALGGMKVQVQTSSLDAQGLGLFGNARQVIGGDDLQVATAGIESATLLGLCAAVEVPVPIAGGFTILLTAADDVEIDATNLVLDITGLEGSLLANDFELGRDASTLQRGGLAGPANTDGIQAARLVVGDAEVEAFSLAAGSIGLSNIRIAVEGRDAGC